MTNIGEAPCRAETSDIKNGAIGIGEGVSVRALDNHSIRGGGYDLLTLFAANVAVFFGFFPLGFILKQGFRRPYPGLHADFAQQSDVHSWTRYSVHGPSHFHIGNKYHRMARQVNTLTGMGIPGLPTTTGFTKIHRYVINHLKWRQHP